MLLLNNLKLIFEYFKYSSMCLVCSTMFCVFYLLLIRQELFNFN